MAAPPHATYCMVFTSASTPEVDGKMPHLLCTEKDIAPIVLLPGDPGRVALFSELLENFRLVSSNREYTVGTGFYQGVPVTVCSTGIGAPSTEIAVAQLIALGAKALIRIGGTGAIQADIPCGSMILNTGAMRKGGTSAFYAPPEYPAIASFEVVDCLKQACEELNQTYTVGICASIASFYHGQGRALPFEKDYDAKAVIEHYRKLRVINMEMEAETIFTLAALSGVLSGSICSVHCNRITDQWLVDNTEEQKQMCRIALLGARHLWQTYLSKELKG